MQTPLLTCLSLVCIYTHVHVGEHMWGTVVHVCASTCGQCWVSFSISILFSETRFLTEPGTQWMSSLAGYPVPRNLPLLPFQCWDAPTQFFVWMLKVFIFFWQTLCWLSHPSCSCLSTLIVCYWGKRTLHWLYLRSHYKIIYLLMAGNFLIIYNNVLGNIILQ